MIELLNEIVRFCSNIIRVGARVNCYVEVEAFWEKVIHEGGILVREYLNELDELTVQGPSIYKVFDLKSKGIV